MQISQVLEQMLVLMLLLSVGFVTAKLGITDHNSNRMLSNIITNLLMPAMIIASSMNIDSPLSPGEVFRIIGLAFIPYLIIGTIAFFVPLIIKAPPETSGTIRFVSMFANVTFMGFPIISALFGQEGLFLNMLLNIPFQFLCYTLGISLMKGSEHKKHARNTAFLGQVKSIFTAPFAASLIAVAVFILDPPIHPVIFSTVSMLGNGTVPLAMIIIGTSLAGMNAKDTLGDWRIYLIAFIKLIVSPVVIRLLMGLFISDILILDILTVLTAMPVATNATMLAIQFGGNESLASKSVFLTTVLSSVTIPLIIHILL